MSAERKRKIGEGHASAIFRLGMRELREVGHFQGSNVAQPSEYGLYGTKTPGEVAEARAADEPNPDEEPRKESVIDKRLNQAKDRDAAKDREASKDRSMDRDLET